MWINEASKYGATNSAVYVCGNKVRKVVSNEWAIVASL